MSFARISSRAIKIMLSILPKSYRLRFDSLFRREVLKRATPAIRIVSTEETLLQIRDVIGRQKGGAYLRFGDGDIFLLKGRSDSLQEVSMELSREIREAFEMSGPNVLKGLAIHSELFGREDSMFPGNHLLADEFAFRLLSESFEYFIGQKIYSPVALHYEAAVNPSFAKIVLNEIKVNCVLFIGNRDLKPEVLESLFGRVSHVRTPARDAYGQIDVIESEAISILNQINGFGVVVIAMGCSTRVVIKRLVKKYPEKFFFDFGSLIDGLNGEETRTWIKVNKLDKAKLLGISS
jgi:hypothetical protein